MSAVDEAVDLRTLLDRYGRMVLIRGFEEEIHRLFLRGEVHGTTHLYAGQEAVAVGVCSQLGDGDWVAGTYRGHGHALACGTDPEALVAEMLGRSTGVCGGRSGSMNVVDKANGLIGCFGIVGGSIGCATGAAMSARLTGNVAVAFFGDGATNQAYFHECLNFAGALTLPVVFVCENNLYGEFTPMAQVTAGADILGRAQAYHMPAIAVDGNDLWAVAEAAGEAVARAREGRGPTLMEAKTYRRYGHSKSDPGAYRPKEEVAAWMERDPLIHARAKLIALGAPEEDVLAVEDAVREQLDQAVAAALAAPYPDPVEDAATEFAP